MTHTHSSGTSCSLWHTFVYTLPVYVRVCLCLRLWRLFWNVRRSWRSFRSIRQSASFSLLLLSDLLSSLYWPWDPLSSVESTPVSIYVPKQVDCNMCRFSKPLLFSFFFCKDGSDRLIKRASFSCCNLLLLLLWYILRGLSSSKGLIGGLFSIVQDKRTTGKKGRLKERKRLRKKKRKKTSSEDRRRKSQTDKKKETKMHQFGTES